MPEQEAARRQPPRLPSIHGSGLMPLGEAMQIGAAHPAVQPGTRKIVLVLTDGKAGCEGSTESAMRHAQQVAGVAHRNPVVTGLRPMTPRFLG